MLRRADPGLILCHLIAEHLLLEHDILRIGIGRPVECRLTGNKRAQASRVYLRGAIFIQGSVLVGSVLSRVELNKDLPSLDDLPILYVNGGDYARLIGLSHLGVPAGNNLALCRSDDIDPSKYRPKDSGCEHAQNGPKNSAADGRGRGLL